jgi:proteasome accessory factor B
VPEGHQPKAMISTLAVERDPRPATLRVRVGTGHSLRRRANTVSPTDDTWSLVEVDFTDTEAFADEISSFGPDVVVEGPTELRESVIRRLAGALGRPTSEQESR